MSAEISAITKICLDFVSGHSSEYFVPEQEAAKFIEASKRLHYAPGINPHNNQPTSKIWRIRKIEMAITGPHWWATPELNRNEDPAGARTIEWHDFLAVTAFVDMNSANYKRSYINQNQCSEGRTSGLRLGVDFPDLDAENLSDSEIIGASDDYVYHYRSGDTEVEIGGLTVDEWADGHALTWRMSELEASRIGIRDYAGYIERLKSKRPELFS